LIHETNPEVHFSEKPSRYVKSSTKQSIVTLLRNKSASSKVPKMQSGVNNSGVTTMKSAVKVLGAIDDKNNSAKTNLGKIQEMSKMNFSN
jgi:hypothetical protein